MLHLSNEFVRYLSAKFLDTFNATSFELTIYFICNVVCLITKLSSATAITSNRLPNQIT